MRPLLDIVRERHSDRMAFDPGRPVSSQDLHTVLEAARWAPTAHNMQNYEIVVVDDPGVLAEIAAIHTEVTLEFIRENFDQLSFSEEELRRKKTGIMATMFPPAWLTPDPNPFETADPEHAFLGHAIQSAPLVLIVLYDSTRRAPASEGDALGFISLGCVLQNIWLTAEELGISMQLLTTMGGEQVEKELRRILDFPACMRVAFGARLGYPIGTPVPGLRVRRDIEDFVHRNTFAARRH